MSRIPNAGGREYISEMRDPFDINKWNEWTDCQSKRMRQHVIDTVVLSKMAPATKELVGIELETKKVGISIDVEWEACKRQASRLADEIGKFAQHQMERMFGSSAEFSEMIMSRGIQCHISKDPRVELYETLLTDHHSDVKELEEYATAQLPYKKVQLAWLEGAKVALSGVSGTLMTLANKVWMANLSYDRPSFRGGGVSLGGE